eukprot:tig00000789_g4142.t1
MSFLNLFEPRDPPARLGKRGREQEDASLALEVVGYGSRIFRDDETAAYLHEERHLLRWNGEEDLMLDRYDVRNLLSDSLGFAKMKSRRAYKPSAEEEALEAQLDEERYRDIDPEALEAERIEQEELEGLEEAEKKRRALKDENAFHAIGFSYEDGDAAGEEAQEQAPGPPEKPPPPWVTDAARSSTPGDAAAGGEGEEAAPAAKEEGGSAAGEAQQASAGATEGAKHAAPPPFVPYLVPEGIQLPGSEREQAVMERTAQFLAGSSGGAGAAAELLRAKQERGGRLAFLWPESPLHAYFALLLDAATGAKELPPNPLHHALRFARSLAPPSAPSGSTPAPAPPRPRILLLGGPRRLGRPRRAVGAGGGRGGRPRRGPRGPCGGRGGPRSPEAAEPQAGAAGPPDALGARASPAARASPSSPEPRAAAGTVRGGVALTALLSAYGEDGGEEEEEEEEDEEEAAAAGAAAEKAGPETAEAPPPSERDGPARSSLLAGLTPRAAQRSLFAAPEPAKPKKAKRQRAPAAPPAPAPPHGWPPGHLPMLPPGMPPGMPPPPHLLPPYSHPPPGPFHHPGLAPFPPFSGPFPPASGPFPPVPGPFPPVSAPLPPPPAPFPPPPAAFAPPAAHFPPPSAPFPAAAAGGVGGGAGGAGGEREEVMEKLASACASCPQLEATVREREKGNPLFAFLQPWHPLRPRYDAALELARRRAGPSPGPPPP